jgi:hypothetical protein
MSEESKINMSESAKKRGISKETREKMLETRKNNRLRKLEEMNKLSLSH